MWKTRKSHHLYHFPIGKPWGFPHPCQLTRLGESLGVSNGTKVLPARRVHGQNVVAFHRSWIARTAMKGAGDFHENTLKTGESMKTMG